MHLLTKAVGIGWVAIGGVLGAHYAGVAAADAPSASLLSYSGGVISPVSVLGAVTLVWVIIDWRMAASRKAKVHAAIVRDKPGLASDPRALGRERRIREKEAKLEAREEKTLRAENRAEKRIVKDSRKENTLERKREHIEVKKEQLRERQNLGR